MEAQSAQSPTATSQPAVLAFQNVCVVELGRNRGGGRSDSSDSGSTTDDDSGGGSSTLRDVSGFAHAGEVVAFIEPGGSGGSTLLRALCGGGSPPATSTRTTARCRLLCVNGQKMPMGSLERAGVASLVQNGKQAAQSLHSLLTVHETLSFAAQLQLPRASQSSHPEQIRYIVNAMRMEHLEQDTVGSLSAGERRRLAIGCTLLLPPTLIFVDELTDGLHLHDAIMLCECLRTIARGKKYTIVVSIRQPTVELMQLLDRFTLLVGERMAFSGEMETAHQFVCANLVAEEAVPRSNSPTHVPHNDKMMAKPASMQRLLDALSHPVEAPAIAVAFTNSECSSELDRVLTAQQACVEDGFTRFTQKRSARSTGVQIAIALKREATVLWRFGEVTDVLREAVRTAILVGLIAFQLEKTAGSARSRLNLLSMLIDLPAYSEASWSKAFINSRPQNEQDMASRVLAPHSHAIVWAVLTMLRALGATVCTMVIAWPMISIGGSLNGWLETCGMMMTTKTIIQMITLWFSVRTDTWEAALRNMGPIYVIWYQCRGWFVRKQANTAASQWLMDYNPARNAWQRMSVLLFAGKDLPCHAAGNATARDGVHQLCPLPGELLLRHNSLEDDPSTDVTVPAVWVVVVLFIFYRAIFVKVAGGSPLKGPLMMCLASFCQRDDTDDNVSTPSGAYVGTTSKSPRKKRSKTSLSRSISVDIIDEVEQILNPPVHLELNALRLMTKDTGVIVQDVSGTVLPTTMMAVLGPSHAGKSSFLRVVAGIADGQVSGEIKVNGQPFDRLLQARIAAFVPQDDSSCLDVLTVEETLRNAADLQLSHASRTVRSTRIFDILRGLRLYKKRGTRLLDLDASEKRRVLIGANGLLTPSRLLLLDEPMRGLLPSDELALMRILSDMCKRFHFTVIFTACQPQTEVMSMADSVLLLSGATTVFNGPRTEIRRFFAAAGYPFGSQNEAVEMMKVASDRKSALTVSKHFSDQVCQATADSPVPVALTRTDLSFPRHFLSEVKALVRRDVLVQFREPMCSTSFVFNLLAFPCVFSLLYWRFEHNVANIEATAGVIWTMQSVWTTLCLTSSTMYYPSRWYPAHREAIRLCRYSIAASCVADTLVTCLRLFIGGYVLGVLQYHVVGLDAGRSFTDSLALVLPAAAVGLTADALSFCYVCCSRNSGRALTAVKMASVVDILSVFAGYYIQVSLLPYVSRQIATFNPIRAAYLLSMSAHFSNTSIPCGSVELADQSVPCPVEGDTAMQMLDVQNNPSTEAVNIVLLIAWPVGLRLIGAIALWNHVRRHRGLAVLEQSIQTAGVTCWYHTAMAIIAKPILWVFYRDLSVIGLDRLPSGPALIACNQSNAVMDQLFIANAFASIDYSIQLMLPAKILEEHSTGILKVIANALNVVPYRRADDYQKDGNGIIHRISLTDGQWSITGALFLRDMEEGCRLRGAWGEILHVQKLLSDKEAIIAEPNYPDRLIPSFRDYKMRVVMLEGGTLVNVHSTVGPWKYVSENIAVEQYAPFSYTCDPSIVCDRLLFVSWRFARLTTASQHSCIMEQGSLSLLNRTRVTVHIWGGSKLSSVSQPCRQQPQPQNLRRYQWLCQSLYDGSTLTKCDQGQSLRWAIQFRLIVK